MANGVLVGIALSTAQGVLTPPNQGTFDKSLSGYRLLCVGGIQAVLQPSIGRFVLWAYGHQGGEADGIRLTLSGYSFTAQGGGTARVTASLPTLSASGTVTALGEVVLNLPHCTLTASGTTDANGRAYLTLYTHYARNIIGGARITGELSGYGGAQSGVTDKIGRVQKTLPRCTLVAHGVTDAHGEVIGVLPTLQRAPSAVLVAKLPRFTLTVIGTTGALTAYEAYSLTFIGDDKNLDVAATHYTKYPFDRFVRFNNKHYGVAADGLYELVGDKFDTDLIVSTYESAVTDFGSQELKRPISLYIGGEVGADFRVTVNSAEIRDDRYTYRPVDKTGVRNYRVLFGKGIRARYLAYAFTNINGGDFVLDDLTPEVSVLRRTA